MKTGTFVLILRAVGGVDEMQCKYVFKHQLMDINDLYVRLRLRLQKNKNYVFKKNIKKIMPTAPSVPRRSPIQVLTRLNSA